MRDSALGLTIPRHIAIIMDGNGRWAEERGQPRLLGHAAGAGAVRGIVETARDLGVQNLSLYTFSTENWHRPAKEVGALMSLLEKYLQAELQTMLQNNIRLFCLGDISSLPQAVGAQLEDAVRKTSACTGMRLNLALNYGGRDELVRAARALARECAAGSLNAVEIDEKLFASHLYTSGQPDPDLLIRTGGESRLSNFLLWQLSYAELYFTDTKWPDFRREHLLAAIEVYNRRQRRFGQTSAQLQQNKTEPL